MTLADQANRMAEENRKLIKNVSQQKFSAEKSPKEIADHIGNLIPYCFEADDAWIYKPRNKEQEEFEDEMRELHRSHLRDLCKALSELAA